MTKLEISEAILNLSEAVSLQECSRDIGNRINKVVFRLCDLLDAPDELTTPAEGGVAAPEPTPDEAEARTAKATADFNAAIDRLVGPSARPVSTLMIETDDLEDERVKQILELAYAMKPRRTVTRAGTIDECVREMAADG